MLRWKADPRGISTTVARCGVEISIVLYIAASYFSCHDSFWYKRDVSYLSLWLHLPVSKLTLRVVIIRDGSDPRLDPLHLTPAFTAFLPSRLPRGILESWHFNGPSCYLGRCVQHPGAYYRGNNSSIQNFTLDRLDLHHGLFRHVVPSRPEHPKSGSLYNLGLSCDRDWNRLNRHAIRRATSVESVNDTGLVSTRLFPM